MISLPGIPEVLGMQAHATIIDFLFYFLNE